MNKNHMLCCLLMLGAVAPLFSEPESLAWRNVAERAMVADAEGLAYSDGGWSLVVTPGSVLSPEGNGNAVYSRALPTPVSGGEVWISVLMHREPIAAGFEDRFRLQLLSGTGGLKYALRSKDDSRNWHVGFVPQTTGTEEVVPLPDTSIEATTLWVVRLTDLQTPNTVMRVWINPPSLKNLGEPVWTSQPFHGQGFEVVQFVSDGNRVGKFDEFRIGSSVPEVLPVLPSPPAKPELP